LKNTQANISSGRNTQEAPERGNRKFLIGAVLGALIGILVTLIAQFFARIFKQPRLVSKAVLSGWQEFDTEETRALFIATENLRSGIAERRLNNGDRKQILHAGYRNFRESWARDFGFAVYGLLALQEIQTIRDTLEAFFWYQRPDGQLPVKLQSLRVFNRFLHSLLGREQPLTGEITQKYHTGHRTVSLDGQALLVVAACEYALQTEAHDFARQNWEKLRLSIQWLQQYRPPGSPLLHQAAYADWADSVARQGAVFYTNMVYWKALHQMSQISLTLDEQTNTQQYLQTAAEVKQALIDQFWHAQLGYFKTSLELDNLSSAGNLLAVAWELVAAEKANSILEALQTFQMAFPVPTQASFPAYPKSLIALENRLGGLGNYHTVGAWLWIGAWHIIALCQLGREQEALQLLSRTARVITRDQQINEVYGLDGQPLATIWYTSEAPLTWNAAMLVYAFQKISAE
jgi:GH15 family glucan-1,4-alpha-glucosidase